MQMITYLVSEHKFQCRLKHLLKSKCCYWKIKNSNFCVLTDAAPKNLIYAYRLMMDIIHYQLAFFFFFFKKSCSKLHENSWSKEEKNSILKFLQEKKFCKVFLNIILITYCLIIKRKFLSICHIVLFPI